MAVRTRRGALKPRIARIGQRTMIQPLDLCPDCQRAGWHEATCPRRPHRDPAMPGWVPREKQGLPK